LVHGGGSTARFWDRLLPLVDAPAFAVDLPGRGDKPADLGSVTVDVEVASVLADVRAAGLGDRDHPIVVVAHSSGGLVVPGVVAGLPEGAVEHIVLSAALIPSEGGCGIECMKPRHREGLTASYEQARRDGTVITLAAPPADPESFRTTYGGDPLDDDTLAYVVDPVRCVTDGVHHYFQPVHWSAAAHVPVTYLLNERDRPIPAALQEEMLGRLPAGMDVTVERLDGGHVPAVTDPKRFAELLASATL
jgi:pimeloyl-ACP methyl ester carboxylesterase